MDTLYPSYNNHHIVTLQSSLYHQAKTGRGNPYSKLDFHRQISSTESRST